MVDDRTEGACELITQRASPIAMAWVSTEHVQGVDAVSTPKMAPTTPMQAWQKPQQALQSLDALPALSLGQGSSELKGASHSMSQKPMPARCGLASGLTPSKSHCRIQLEVEKEGFQLHKENLLSFSLSKYEKKYQNVDMATPLRNHTGPSCSHRVRAPAGYSRVLPTETCVSPEAHATETKALHTDFRVLPDKSPRRTQNLFGTYALSERCQPIAHDMKVNFKTDDSASLYSPLPGEVANNAYKLYSEMLPSIDGDADLCLSIPSLEHMDIRQHLPSALHEQKPLVRDRCERSDARLEGGKKIKFSTIKEEDTSQSLLDVKQEPFLDEPCHIVGTTSAAQDSPSHGYPCQFRGHGSEEVMSVQPAGGLKFFTRSAYVQSPKSRSAFFAGEPSILLPSEPSSKILDVGDEDWGKFLALSATPVGKTDTASMLPFQQRFKELQAFLKQCDEVDQNECVQALRSLSAAARSGYAVDLETRAIRLSLEEGKEMKRLRLLNVLGRLSERSLDDAGATPQGPRLPAPGATSKLEHAP